MAVDACSQRAFSRHTHYEFGIGLITSGAQRSWSGRGQVEAVKGNLITVNPAESHDGVPIGGRRAWSMLYFSQPLVSDVVADLEEGRRTTRELQAPVVDDPRLADLFVAARTAVMREAAAPAFEERLLSLFAGLFCGTGSRVSPVAGRLARVRERIDDSPTAPHPLCELAALCGLSRYQTVRGFARMTGLTPHAYVMQRRLDLARELIRQGIPLADAAYMSGFFDQSHLNRVFVARHGFTPGAYAGALHRPGAISSKIGPDHAV